MDFFSRRRATPAELKKGEKQMREAKERIDREVMEPGILALEKEESELGDSSVGNGPSTRVEGEQVPLTYPIGSLVVLKPSSSEAQLAPPVQGGRGEKEQEKIEEVTPEPQKALESRRMQSEEKEERSQGGLEEGRGQTLFTMYTPPGSEGAGLESGAVPLFDREQLARLTMLQQQAPWLYLGGDHRGFLPYLPRPEVLTREEAQGLQLRVKEAREASLREEEERRKYMEI